jgi:D-glycero-D-manno-heptose 1,7-bisphosphate phosphatase
MQELKAKGFIFIVITNQGGISKKYYSHEDVARVHEKLKQLLANFGVELAGIYYCPHHSDNENCLCRKPGTISFEKAISRFDIDRSKSYFVGDRETDMEAGKKAGLQCILVEPNQNMRFLSKIIN